MAPGMGFEPMRTRRVHRLTCSSLAQGLRIIYSAIARAVFGVATCGSGPGWALYTLDRLLKEKGTRLSAGFALTMPDNVVIVLNRIPPTDVQEPMLASSKKKMAQIAENVRRKKYVVIEGEKRLSAP